MRHIRRFFAEASIANATRQLPRRLIRPDYSRALFTDFAGERLARRLVSGLYFAIHSRTPQPVRLSRTGGAPGGAGPYVTGPARPKAATPGNRGPAVARGGADAPSGAFRKTPEAPPGAPSPGGGDGKKGTRRSQSREQPGRRSVGWQPIVRSFRGTTLAANIHAIVKFNNATRV